ncbi:MAG: two-component sensor histidine kinase, partial [Aeromonas sp.]|nr:two-component sensor histidine kinase [Aeromonas sp.]
MSRVRSIRRFLLSGILALVSLSLAVSGLIGYLEANHEMEELFDARLAQSARITNQLLSRYLKQRGELPSNGAVYQEWEQAVPADPHQEKRSFSQLGR